MKITPQLTLSPHFNTQIAHSAPISQQKGVISPTSWLNHPFSQQNSCLSRSFHRKIEKSCAREAFIRFCCLLGPLICRPKVASANGAPILLRKITTQLILLRKITPSGEIASQFGAQSPFGAPLRVIFLRKMGRAFLWGSFSFGKFGGRGWGGG